MNLIDRCEMDLIDKLAIAYKSLPQDSQKKIKYGLSWAVLQIQRMEDDLENVKRCKNCRNCYKPIGVTGKYDGYYYCVKLLRFVNESNYCCFGDEGEDAAKGL